MVASSAQTNTGPKSSDASKPTLDPACVDAVLSSGNVFDWGGTVSFPVPELQGICPPRTCESVACTQDSDGPTTLQLHTQVAETDEKPQGGGKKSQGESQTIEEMVLSKFPQELRAA